MGGGLFWGAKSFNLFKMGTSALLVSTCKFNLVAQRCIILGGPKQSANVFQDMEQQLRTPITNSWDHDGLKREKGG